MSNNTTPNKNKHISIRLSDETLTVLKQAAIDNDMSVSQYISYACRIASVLGIKIKSIDEKIDKLNSIEQKLAPLDAIEKKLDSIAASLNEIKNRA